MDIYSDFQPQRRDILEILQPLKWLCSLSRKNIDREAYHTVRHQVIFDGAGRATKGIIALSTTGCSYARSFGACSICGHPVSCIWDTNIKGEDTLALFQNSLARLREHRPSMVCVYCSGSFFDELEITERVRLQIFRSLAGEDWIENLSFESLPQFLSRETLRETAELLLRKKLMIGMGLDCSNEEMRAILTLKKIKDTTYKMAVQNCLDAGVVPMAYIIVKPPFLTKGESVWEAAQAIHTAAQFGYNHVSLEPVALQQGTLQSLLWPLGLYERPTIWTILNSILFWRKSYPLEYKSLTLRIGGEIFTPAPYLTYAMCKSCESIGFPALRSIGVNFEGRLSQEQRDTCCTQSHFLISKPYVWNLFNRIKDIEVSVRDRIRNIEERGVDYACPAI